MRRMDETTNDRWHTTDAQPTETRSLREHGFQEALAAAVLVEATKTVVIHYGNRFIAKKSKPNDDATGEDD